MPEMPGFTRDIFLAFMRVHILHHAVEGPIYGSEMMEELRRHGHTLGPGTLYPILHSMQEGGYLTCTPQTVNGKIRKYYRATEKGKQALDELLPRVEELVREVAGSRADASTDAAAR